MDWKEKYKEKLLSLDAAAQKVDAGDRVLVGMGVGIPYALLDEVTKRCNAMELYIGMAASPIKAYLPPYNKSVKCRNWFYGPIERASLRLKPDLSYQPMHLSDTTFDRTGNHCPDCVLLQVTPPNEDGMLSQGPCPLPAAVLMSGVKVIAQVNECVPYVRGEGCMIPVDRVDWFTESSASLYPLESAEPSETDIAIAGYITERVPDGACIQLGIGGLATAVGSFLKDKRELGIHTEMFVESMVDLIECGAVTNSRKMQSAQASGH